MTVLTTSAGKLSTRAASRAAGYRVELIGRLANRPWRAGTRSIRRLRSSMRNGMQPGMAPSPAEVEPLIAIITDAVTGEQAALLPLIRRRQNGIRIVEFADLDLDRLQRAAARPCGSARCQGGAHAVAQSARGAAPHARRRRSHPPAQARRRSRRPAQPVCACSMMPGRARSMATSSPPARITTPGATRWKGPCARNWSGAGACSPAMPPQPSGSPRIMMRRCKILSTTEAQQGTRMQNLGLNFILNDATCAAFYRNLVRDGVGNGYALVSVLMAGEEVVATLLGIRNGSRYVMIRISNAGEKWSNCSPGRLIIERTMAALHSDGVREFDFSIGNYAYKRRFGVKPLPLVDLSAALSWRGLPYALARSRRARIAPLSKAHGYS